MNTIKCNLKSAQKTKKLLIENNLLDRLHIPIKENSFIFFPINSFKKTKMIFKNGIFEKKELDKVKKKDFKSLLPKNIDVPSSVDVIGDIIIIEIKENMIKNEKKIAKALLKTYKNTKTILKKAGEHSGEFRTQALKYLAGINKKETAYKENNTKISLDVEKIYFSSRLSTERKRIFKKIKKGEKVLVMFAGCGPYPLTISKNTNAKKIIGVEKNPIASEYFNKNIILNKINNIEAINGDVKKIVPKLDEKFDRIIMPLPKDAAEFLYLAFHVSKKGTIIHLYGFEHEKEFNIALKKVDDVCRKHNIKYKLIELVKCGQDSPGKFRICVDFKILS